MKHIAIIPNYSGITGMINGGEISPNFLVKAENDGKVYFSNAAGLRLVVDSGNTYNMYAVGSVFEADFSSTSGFSFQIIDADNQYLTANFDWDAEADDGTSVVDINSGSTQGENHFTLSWGHGDTSWEVVYDPANNLVQVIGRYRLTDQEACEWHGGTWNPETEECEGNCEDGGLCGDWPDCYECSCEEQFPDDYQAICECEGRYWYNDTCNDEPQPTCEEQGLCGEDPNYCYECDCEEQYEEGTQELCECQGKYWYNDTCNDEPESEPTCEDQYEEGTQELCDCQGRYWWGDECHDEEEPEPESDEEE